MIHGGTLAVEGLVVLALAAGVLVAVAMPVVVVVLLAAMPKRNGPREGSTHRGSRGFPVVLRDDPSGQDRHG